MIEEKVQIDHLSASQISLYLQCSLKYRFLYIDRLPPPFKASGLAFGSVIHSALDWFHKEKIKGNARNLEKLLQVFEVDWFSQRVETEIRYKDGETEVGLLLIGRQMLSQYFHSFEARPIDSEIPFALPLIEPTTGEVLSVRLEGVMDLIEQGHVIVDFKTSARSMDLQSLKDSHQLTCYSYAYQMLFQKEPSLLKVVNFVKNKIPKMVVLETTREKEDYQRLFYLAKAVLRGIQLEVFFPRPSFICKDCEFEAPCQSWRGNGN